MTAKTVVIIGDAISRGSARNAAGGFTAPIRPSWRYWLWKALRDNAVEADFVGSQTAPDFPADQFDFDQGNECRGGTNTTGWSAERVAGWIAGYTFDAAIVFLGTEDAFQQVPVATRIANIEAIVADIRERCPTAGILIAQLPPTTDGANGTYRTQKQIVPFNTALVAMRDARTTTASPIVLVDCFTGFTPAMSDDGLKPNEAGEQFIAAKFLEPLKAFLNGQTAAPPTGTGDDDEEPVPGAVIPVAFECSKVEGTIPLVVRCFDRSTVDRKKLRRTVIPVGVDLDFVKEMVSLLPPGLFDVVYTTANDGVNYDVVQATASDGKTITVPWPLIADHVCVSKHRDDPAGINFGDVFGVGSQTSTGASDARAACGVLAGDLAGLNYGPPARTLLHELLHTIRDLENVDTIRTSEYFLAWLREHDPTNPFADDPATAPITAALKDQFATYLVERYKAHPTLNNCQVAYAWDFGDGETSTERHPEHTYTVAGSYTLSLTVTSPWGTGTATRAITVHPTTVPPVAGFAVLNQRGEAPLGVQFIAATTGGTPTSWRWEFGDGAVSTATSPTHVYTAPGFYSPTLTVTNAGGSDSYIGTGVIEVLPPEEAPVPTVELTRAGLVDLLTAYFASLAFVEFRDGAGLPLSPRVASSGLVCTIGDDLTMTLDLNVLGSDLPTLPQMVSSVAFYATITGGDALATAALGESLTDYPTFYQPNDLVDLSIHVNLLAGGPDLPALRTLVIENAGAAVGSAASVRAIFENVPASWIGTVVSVSPLSVDAGGLIRVRFRLAPR